MKRFLLVIPFVIIIVFECQAQPTELYVFKNERKEHLAAARKARAVAREKAVAKDFYMRVRTQTSVRKATMQLTMRKPHETVVRITDMNGMELATLYRGTLEKGVYEFAFVPQNNLRKPFVCQVLIDGKTEAMKVVKFNSF